MQEFGDGNILFLIFIGLRKEKDREKKKSKRLKMQFLETLPLRGKISSCILYIYFAPYLVYKFLKEGALP